MKVILVCTHLVIMGGGWVGGGGGDADVVDKKNRGIVHQASLASAEE